MTAASERIPVLVTGAEKARISKAAKAAGVSMGEYLRRAASSFVPSEDDAALDGLLTQVRKTTATASAAIESAMVEIDASNERIAAMERRAKAKTKAVS